MYNLMDRTLLYLLKSTETLYMCLLVGLQYCDSRLSTRTFLCIHVKKQATQLCAQLHNVKVYMCDDNALISITYSLFTLAL